VRGPCLTPVLMTAMVTALGLLPLALSAGEPGKEIEGPMAVIILGGLVTSTVLNLVVPPTVALRYSRFLRTIVTEVAMNHAWTRISFAVGAHRFAAERRLFWPRRGPRSSSS